MSNAVAFIPARGGSKRIPGKNIKLLAGHPLIAYTISLALQSQRFSGVFVSTDSPETAQIARQYGARIIDRPPEISGDTSPDIQWLQHALDSLEDSPDELWILRPTSPFRTLDMLERAAICWQVANRNHLYDSLRAVEKCSQHPGKMWHIVGDRMVPFILQPDHPFHDSQYAALPPVYVQNASLEIMWAGTVRLKGNNSGTVIYPFRTSGNEGFDLNQAYDWDVAEEMIRRGEAELPEIHRVAEEIRRS